MYFKVRTRARVRERLRPCVWGVGQCVWGMGSRVRAGEGVDVRVRVRVSDTIGQDP